LFEAGVVADVESIGGVEVDGDVDVAGVVAAVGVLELVGVDGLVADVGLLVSVGGDAVDVGLGVLDEFVLFVVDGLLLCVFDGGFVFCFTLLTFKNDFYVKLI